jgi:hypothetical protein
VSGGGRAREDFVVVHDSRADGAVAGAVRRSVLTSAVGTLAVVLPVAWLLRDAGGIWLAAAAGGIGALRLGRTWLRPLESRSLAHRDPVAAVLEAGGVPPRPDGREWSEEEWRMEADDLAHAIAGPHDEFRRSGVGRALLATGWGAGILVWPILALAATLSTGLDPGSLVAAGIGSGLFAAGGALTWRHERRRERALALLEEIPEAAPSPPQRRTQT